MVALRGRQLLFSKYSSRPKWRAEIPIANFLFFPGNRDIFQEKQGGD
jgi:hypothetical protein